MYRREDGHLLLPA